VNDNELQPNAENASIEIWRYGYGS